MTPSTTMTTQTTPATLPTYTPGPWRYEPETKTIRSVPQNYWLATMDSWDGAVNNGANARLIAAAPDLLTSLRRLYEATYGRTDLVCQLDFEQARAAIAKAINA